MAAIPPKAEQEIINRMYDSYKEAREPFRLTRMGASSIGNECNRAVWLSWRGYSETNFEGRMLRLFQTGHLQEERVIADLRAAGLTVHDRDEDGNQFTWTDESGHFVVKVDGVVTKIPGSSKPHVLEVKTSNDKGFQQLVKNGVQKAKPFHYTQVQSGMARSGLVRALYVCVNKNDESYYVERIREDKEFQATLGRKIIMIKSATMKPARIADDPESFVCKYCDEREPCYGNAKPKVTCRSCVHSEPIEAGAWRCNRYGSELDHKAQLEACPSYEVL